MCRKIFIFPWYLSNATYKFLPFLQGADLLGGFGLTAIIVLVNVAFYRLGQWFWARRRGQPIPFPRWAVGLGFGLLALDVVYGMVRIGQVEAVAATRPSIRIGVVEANIGMFEKTDPELILNNMLIHQRMSADLEARGADLIVWPETAANPPLYAVSREPTTDLAVLSESLELLERAPRDATWYRPSEAAFVGEYREDFRRRTPRPDIVGIQRGFRTPLLFGALTVRQPTPEEAADKPPHPRRPSHIRYNTAILIDADGRVLGSYDKNVLLVFGEWVPLSHWLWRTFGLNFYEMVPAAGDVTPGEEVVVLELPLEDNEGQIQDVRIGTMICYEDIIAGYALRMAELEPNLFINIINDAWFDDSTAAYHHLAFSVMRAVEHRIPLVRATNTGVSSIIDPVGRIVAQTSLYDAETLLEDVPIMPPPATVYSKVGDVVGWAAWIAVVGMAFRRRRAPVAA